MTLMRSSPQLHVGKRTQMPDGPLGLGMTLMRASPRVHIGRSFAQLIVFLGKYRDNRGMKISFRDLAIAIIFGRYLVSLELNALIGL